LEKFVALPELDLPRAQPAVENGATREAIEIVAQDVRRSWGIPPGPIDDVVRTLERHGIVTTRFYVGMDDVDAFCVAFTDRPIIALGADKGKRDRSRFDATHELGHLVMHHAEQVGSKVIETQAHQFAAAFLMPADDIREELPRRADWTALLKLKAKWHVSIAALLMRARALNVMDEHTYSQAWKTLSVRGWRKQEPGELGPPESPVLLQRALDVAADAGMAFEELLQRSGLPENDVRAILGRTTDPRPRVEL
jgi:Zn-dependent peptidase ImmA (M78 family)